MSHWKWIREGRMCPSWNWCFQKLNPREVVLTVPHSIIMAHSEHMINKIIWPFPMPHPYPCFPVYVKGHASMRKNRGQTDTRQGEMMQTSEIDSGKERWYKQHGWKFRSKNKQKGMQMAYGWRRWKGRYLPRPALSSYRPVDLYYQHWVPHWAPQIDHCWMRPVTHQARTQEENTFFSTIENVRQLGMLSCTQYISYFKAATSVMNTHKCKNL